MNATPQQVAQILLAYEVALDGKPPTFAARVEAMTVALKILEGK